LLDLEALRQGRLHRGHRLVDARDDVERARPLRLEHRQEPASLTVRHDQARLRRVSVAHVGDVSQVDGRSTGVLYRQVVEAVDDRGARVGEDRILERADLRGARREDQVLIVYGGRDVRRRESPRVELRSVEIDDDLALLTADRERKLRALHGRERWTQKVRSDVVDLLLVERGARETELENGHVGRAVRDDEWRRRTGRHRLHDRVRRGRDLRHGCVRGDAGLQEDLRDGHASERLALDVLDPAHGGRGRALELGRDPTLHLARLETGVRPDRCDDRNVDLRIDVRRHAQDRHRSHQDDEHGEHHERVWAPERELHDPHAAQLRNGRAAEISPYAEGSHAELARPDCGKRTRRG